MKYTTVSLAFLLLLIVLSSIRADEPIATEADYAAAGALSRVFRDASQKVIPATVKIISHSRSSKELEALRNRSMLRIEPGSRLPGDGLGTGVILDSSGVIMTNYHVVQGAQEVEIELADGRQFKVSRIRFDDRTDLAVLWVKPNEPLPFAKFGDSNNLDIGDWVLAIGNPFDLDSTVSAGIISAKGRALKRVQRGDMLQTDAAINPGNSGGPLINLKGEVIGINTAITSMTGANQGIGFAIPSADAEWVFSQLLKNGSVQRAWLGVETLPVNAELAKKLGVAPRTGVMIDMLIGKGTPADRAKLYREDVILSFDGQDVYSPADLQRCVERADISVPHKMIVVRDKQKRQVEVTLEAMPLGADAQRSMIGNRVDSHVDVTLGISILTLTPEMAIRMGMRGRTGLLVFDVVPGSRAHKAGFEKGMVLDRLDGKQLSSTADYISAKKESSMSEGIVFETISEGDRKKLVIKAGM